MRVFREILILLFYGKQELKILKVRILWPKRKLNDEDVGREIQISLAAGPSVLEAGGWEATWVDLRAGEELPPPPWEGPEDAQRGQRVAGPGEGLSVPWAGARWHQSGLQQAQGPAGSGQGQGCPDGLLSLQIFPEGNASGYHGLLVGW